MFICPNCSMNLHFDPATQRLKCDYCDSSFSTEEYKKPKKIQVTEEPDPGAESPWPASDGEEQTVDPTANDSQYFDATLFICPQCGAQIYSTDETAATFCSYCGSSVLLDSRISRQKKPDYVIPFTLTKEDCENAYRKTLKRAFFAPKKMAEEVEIEKFRGIYMPYWVYNYHGANRLSAKGSKSYRRGNYIYTDHYRIETEYSGSYEGISFDAASGFSDNLSGAIAPFDIKTSSEFTPAYLSGFYADAGDVKSYVYDDNAREIVTEDAIRKIRKSSGSFSKYGVSDGEIRGQLSMKNKEPQMAFFPVWFLASRNKKGDRVSYAVVNGQSGSVAADIPIDFTRYLLGSLLLAIPLFFILNMGFTLTPEKALIFSLIFNLISILISNKQLNQIYTRDTRADDEGYTSTHGYPEEIRKKSVGKKTNQNAKKENSGCLGIAIKVIIGIAVFGVSELFLPILVIGAAGIGLYYAVKAIAGQFGKGTVPTGKAIMPMKEKFPVLIKPLIGILLSLIVLIATPAMDLYYYIAAAISLVAVIISFLDIVNCHNKLAARKLPQFDARGGDGA